MTRRDWRQLLHKLRGIKDTFQSRFILCCGFRVKLSLSSSGGKCPRWSAQGGRGAAVHPALFAPLRLRDSNDTWKEEKPADGHLVQQ